MCMYAWLSTTLPFCCVAVMIRKMHQITSIRKGTVIIEDTNPGEPVKLRIFYFHGLKYQFSTRFSQPELINLAACMHRSKQLDEKKHKKT